MKLLVVESPAKAKTIKSYLDSDFEVIASVGHIRDLPQKGIGIDEKNNFYVENWELDKKKVDPIIKSVKRSDEIFLALDPDREGELIAWHLVEICKEKKLIEKKSFKRIEFSAVRKEDILDALKKPREINQDLVNAAMTRRFLDRFFGYKISPITKRRTIFGTSAGRVQSPALKVLCEKEKEIDVFVSREFWEISVELMDKDENKIQCSLLMDKDKKFDKFSIDNKEKAEEIRKKIEESVFQVSSINKREKKRNPYSPFSNSLLLQDASSKLGFSPKLTNSVAQELKDGIGSLGALITYHRSDSNKMKKSEVTKLREQLKNDYGNEFVSSKEIFYKERAKFVQQGHEAVTPTDLNKKPEHIKSLLNENQFKLYDLIWKRTLASQMSPSINLETTYYIKTDNFLLKASGSIEKFKGYKKIYNFKEKMDNEQQLPNLSENEKLTKSNISIKQNFTKPPNRYSEAGLIKKLEELGIGRPSTYVSIFTKLQDRSYIEIKNKSLIPTSKGKILSKFFDGFFNQFVDYKFTANLEEQLDLITESKLEWKNILKDFLYILNKTVNDVENTRITDVIDKINECSPEILKEKKCPKCSKGSLTIKFAYTGPFIGCTEYSKEKEGCNYSHAIGSDEENKELSGDGKKIGVDPKTGKEILLKIGRYGRYLEIESEDKKLKRTSIPKKMRNEEIDLDKAIKFLSLPRKIGIHPDTKKDIVASIGPYGPYLKHNNKFLSLKDDDVTDIGINRAVELIEKNIQEKKEIIVGKYPETDINIIRKKGIKGRSDYLSFKRKNFSIPKEFSEKELSLDDAIKIIDEKNKKK
jgi:DNA topoisomerase-1